MGAKKRLSTSEPAFFTELEQAVHDRALHRLAVHGNTAMMRAFQRLGAVRVRDVGAGSMNIDVELPLAGAGMRAALRSVATGHVGPSPAGAVSRAR